MNHFVLSAQWTCLFAAGACVYSITRRKGDRRTGRLLGWYWLSIAFWSFTVGWQGVLLRMMPDVVWGWVLHLGVLFVPTLFLHVALVLAQREAQYRVWLRAAYLLTVGYLLLNTWTPWFTHGTAYRDHYAYPIPAAVYPAYFASFVASVMWGTVLLMPVIKFLPPTKRGVAYVALVGHSLGYLGGLDNFAIMWDIRIFPLYPFGLYGACLYGAAVVWALRADLLQFLRVYRTPRLFSKGSRASPATD